MVFTGSTPAVAAVVISRQASRPLIAPLLPVLCPLLLPLSLASALAHLAVRVAHPLLSGLVLEFPEDRLVPLPIPGIPGLTVIVPVELTLPPLMGPDGIFESEGLGARGYHRSGRDGEQAAVRSPLRSRRGLIRGPPGTR
jgi:hypothetical protein